MPTTSLRRRILLRLGAVCALAPMAALPVAAADFPTKPVRIVVAFTAGAAPDVLARSLSATLSKRWGTPVVVENKLGADGVISSDFVAKAAPDGHTLYLATMGNIALAPHMVDKLPYDAKTAFRGVGFIAANPFAILMRQNSPIRSVADMVSLSKSKPLNYGGAGTLGPLVGSIIAKRTGADLQYVAYKGAQPAITDLLGGQIDMVIADLPSLLPFQARGQARLLAVTTEARSALAPEVHTMAESGFKDFDFSTWYGLVAPSGTPKEVVAKINSDLLEALRSPEVSRQMQSMGLTARTSTPEAMDQLILSEIDRWGQLIKAQR